MLDIYNDMDWVMPDNVVEYSSVSGGYLFPDLDEACTAWSATWWLWMDLKYNFLEVSYRV